MEDQQPIDSSLERLYEEPHSVRERHFGLMFRGGEPLQEDESAAGDD
ncbi:MAG TPA: hypothetical protein VMW62_04505 [Chloroflexota bacterium]|nr:hypothetical protein [Chloroflexota bacterium]